ncbi:MAG: ABC transporter ATP-binding protein, partial [Actinomycetes bacterium]
MIEIKQISFSRPTKEIFTNFSAQISPTGATLLTGANGSGKTTLINLIGGVLKPHSGSIIINGLDIKRLCAKEQSKIRSVAPQRRIFDLAFTVNEILEIVPPSMSALHAPDVLEALEIRELADLKVTELS